MSKAWFRPKRYGYGSGLPIAWQGWAVLIAYMLAVGGYTSLVRAIALPRPWHFALVFGGVLALTVLLVAICRATTEGGWRWRAGEDA